MTLADNEQVSSTPDQPVQEALDFGDISVHINGAVDQQCQDLGGSVYTKISNDASQAHRFVFCIFIFGRGISSEDKMKIFVRLNTGLLAEVSWALHLYSNASMVSAQSMFAYDMYHRNQPDYSTHIPPSYVGPPLQIYRHVYMCLDASKPQPNDPPSLSRAQIRTMLHPTS
jgi:hypothetical protein